MGFDIYGLSPKNETGKYFRNNCWGWRRLADFILEHVDLPEDEKKYWQSNDGQKVSDKSALGIAKFIREANKEKSKYKDWVSKSAAEYQCGDGTIHYPFTWSNTLDFAEFCENCGGFEIC